MTIQERLNDFIEGYGLTNAIIKVNGEEVKLTEASMIDQYKYITSLNYVDEAYFENLDEESIKWYIPGGTKAMNNNGESGSDNPTGTPTGTPTGSDQPTGTPTGSDEPTGTPTGSDVEDEYFYIGYEQINENNYTDFASKVSSFENEQTFNLTNPDEFTDYVYILLKDNRSISQVIDVASNGIITTPNVIDSFGSYNIYKSVTTIYGQVKIIFSENVENPSEVTPVEP